MIEQIDELANVCDRLRELQEKAHDLSREIDETTSIIAMIQGNMWLKTQISPLNDLPSTSESFRHTTT